MRFLSIIWLILFCFQQLPLRAESDLALELDAMAEDEIIVRYRPKLALKNKLVHKYKTAQFSSNKIHRELDSEIIKSIAKHYHLSVDEGEPTAHGYSRLSSNAVYHNPSSSSTRLKVNARDASSVALLRLRKKTSKLQLRRIISRMNSERLQTNDYDLIAAYPNYIFEITNTVDDPYYSSQKALEQINIDKAWSKSQGEGVVVAVIDTGVDYKHKDLANNIWQNSDEIPNNLKDDDNNGYIDDDHGWDFVKEGGLSCLASEDCDKRDNDPSDINGHGTHVAGIIAAEQNNEFGVTGVAPKAQIMPLRAAYSVGYSAYLKSSDVAEAVEYAIRNGADVINMSFAGSRLGVLEDVVKRAQELGIVMVAAAGNSSSSTATYPAALDEVIAVGSVDASGVVTEFSNYGDWVDIVAPGVAILSTSPDDGFARKTGTSMSAPFVSGVAALVISKSRELNLSPEEVRQRILSSSSDISKSGLLIASTAQLNADIVYPLQVDSMEVPRVAGLAQKVHFSASASEGDQSVKSYEWNSSIDGHLSSEADFEIENLSPGDHKISLRVENNAGDWSEPVSKTITIDKQARLFTQNVEKLSARIMRRNGRLMAMMPRSSDDFVEEYLWTSSKDGDFSNERSFPITKLSPGLHKISLTLHDKRGYFSAPIERVIDIRI